MQDETTTESASTPMPTPTPTLVPTSAPTPRPHAYMFKHEAAAALLKALGLEGHKVTKVVLTFDIHDAVTAQITEFSIAEKHSELCTVLTSMGPWLVETTSAEDDMRHYERPTHLAHLVPPIKGAQP